MAQMIQAEDAVATRQNVLKSQLPLIIIAATVVLLTGVWLLSRPRSKCDSIFEQAADKVRANLDFIKVKGKLALGSERVQDLTEASQKVALHLKSCCVAQQAGALNAEQFQACMSGAKDYQTQIIQVATNLKEADTAEKQQKPELAKQKIEAAKEQAGKLSSTEKTLAKATQTLTPSPVVKAGAEQEPNNIISQAEQEPNNAIPQANVAEIGSSIAAEINPADDVDYFKFQYQDEKKRRDIVLVRLDNRSTTLQPAMILHNEDRTIDRPWNSPNAPGADDKFAFPVEPGKIFYVGIASYSGRTSGKYALAVTAQKAYDRYEPNDDAFTATRLKVGDTIEANIMDGADVDSYRFSGVTGKSLTVQLENLSGSLQPSIRVLKSDRSRARDWDAPNVTGANLTFSLESEPGQDYFVEVGAYAGRTAGPYKLTVR